MKHSKNADEPPKFKKAADGRGLSTERATSDITNNDDEDVLKNNADTIEEQGEPLPVVELKDDLEEEENLDEQA